MWNQSSHAAGIEKVVMLTGDNERTALAQADVGIAPYLFDPFLR